MDRMYMYMYPIPTTVAARKPPVKNNGKEQHTVAPVSAKTIEMNRRFNEVNAHGKLEKHYPQLNQIITVLCNVSSATDLDILNFLMAKKSIEECGFSGSNLSKKGAVGEK
jgi:hypothetical protein